MFLLCCHHCPVGADLFSPASLTDLLHRSLLEVRDDLLYVGVRGGEEGEECTLLCSSAAGGVICDIYTCACVCACTLLILCPSVWTLQSSGFFLDSGLGIWTQTSSWSLLVWCFLGQSTHHTSQQSHNS